MARVLGIEPRTTESKSVVLPLHHTPIISQNPFYFQLKVDFLELRNGFFRKRTEFFYTRPVTATIGVEPILSEDIAGRIL